METELKQPVVTEEDVLKGFKEIEVLARNGEVKKIMVKALSWRVALGATFKSLAEAMIHMLEHCVEKEAHIILDAIIPLHLVWVTNVAQQLTNGIIELKKAAAAKATATTPPAAPTPGSMPPSAS